MQVGRYNILEIIGTGANGRVARAHDPLIDRLVAIKLFSPELASGVGRQRFFQEARVVGQLSHPYIIAVHDMGIEESSSTPYIVMEYLKGSSLDRILNKGSVPFPKACAWAADVATALDVAHSHGVIHGDVKTANILITDQGRVKLMDFGMARLASHNGSGSPLLGTPAYWCPEQIQGKPQDARSDIFSLGVVLYEMITGHRPFDADSLQGICSRVLSSTPLSPSRVNASLPATFDSVIASCLAKDPAERFGKAANLADTLYPFARRKTESPGQPIQQSPSIRDRASRLLRSA